MNKASQFSDEPTRVAHLMKHFLSGQSGSILSSDDQPEIRLTIGADQKDDCAVYEMRAPVALVVGSDYVRGPKFMLYELGLLSNFDLGYYVVAANVSDVAAMGAMPIGILTVVRYPNDLDDDGFHELMAGIHQAATDFGTLNVGGDIGQAERIILSATALGICEVGKVLTRRGAHEGDLLCVTGSCGILGAAVAYFPKQDEKGWKLESSLERALLQSWQKPQARVAEGQLLASKPFATSCQDTSDGLKATIEQIGEASHVGFEVFEDSVPLDPAVEAVAELMGVEPLALAMSASADFHLTFTIPQVDSEVCREAFDSMSLNFHIIGRATSHDQGIRSIGPDGAERSLPGVAWKHQKNDISTLVTDVSPKS
jgi:thiamine-monophosphate kinase